MPKTARKHRASSHLPKTPPKRTGKAGPRPLDPDPEEPKSAGEPIEPKGQADLPGMEDREIEELEHAAQRYANIRDDRMALNLDEKKLKDVLLALMKKHEKEHYHRDGITIDLVREVETVKVRVNAKDEE